jgi:tripartite-type tricarboxylate transporter receptor subunit TctC
MNTVNRRIAGMGIAAASLAGMQWARAQPRTTRLVIPFPAGGAIDGVARLLAQHVADAMGRSVIVDNRPGANGAIAAAAVANAAPDGSTVLCTTTSIIQIPILQKNTPYRLEALAPVSKLAVLPVGFAVPAKMPVNNIQEMMEWVRRNPDKASYGTFGAGSSAHIMGETLNKAAGAAMLHAPFRGEAPALAALLGDQITAMFGATGTLAEQVKAGRLKVLAVALPKRLEVFPDVPTFAEAGFPAVNQPGWYGAFVPKATPAPLRNEFNDVFVRTLKKPEVIQKIADYGFLADPVPTDEFVPFVAKENDAWSKLITAAGVSLD